MRETKAVILDFDGTIGDTRGLIVCTMQQTIAALGLDSRSDDECAAMIGLPLRDTFTKLIPMDEAMGDRCVEVYTELFFKNNSRMRVPLFPHVTETIKRLHAGGRLLTIASSRQRASLLMFLRDMQLERYITYIVSASDVEQAKPAPDMVMRTLADNGLAPDQAIVVGDTVYDIQMAHNAGVAAIGVTYGNGTRGELLDAGVEYIIDDFAEVADIVLNKKGRGTTVRRSDRTVL